MRDGTRERDTKTGNSYYCTHREDKVSVFGLKRHDFTCSIVRDTNLVVIASVWFETCQLHDVTLSKEIV